MKSNVKFQYGNLNHGNKKKTNTNHDNFHFLQVFFNETMVTCTCMKMLLATL